MEKRYKNSPKQKKFLCKKNPKKLFGQQVE